MSTFVAKSSGMSKDARNTAYAHPAYAGGDSVTQTNEFYLSKNSFMNGSTENTHLVDASQQQLGLGTLAESQDSYEKTYGVESSQNVKTKFSGGAETGSNNKLAGSRAANFIDPSPSGITRIYINHLSSSNNVVDKIRDVNEKLRYLEASTSSSNVNGSLKLKQDRAANGRKDESTSPIKIYESKSNEMKTNYSDFDLIAPKTQGFYLIHVTYNCDSHAK